MSLDVVVASTDRDLTTTGALKALLFGATATSTAKDDYLATLIRRSSAWAETFLGYPPTAQSYRECVPGYGRRFLTLSGGTPLRSVAALYDATDTGTATLLTTEFRVESKDAGMLSRDQGWAWNAPLQAPGSFGGVFPSGIPLIGEPLSGQEYRPWLVDYVGGWTYGGIDTGSPNWSTAKGSTSTGRTLPEDVEQAVILRAKSLFESNPDGVASESLGDVSVSYRTIGGSGSDYDDATSYGCLLARFRRVA